jgi:hypothetical protein
MPPKAPGSQRAEAERNRKEEIEKRFEAEGERHKAQVKRHKAHGFNSNVMNRDSEPCVVYRASFASKK